MGLISDPSRDPPHTSGAHCSPVSERCSGEVIPAQFPHQHNQCMMHSFEERDISLNDKQPMFEKAREAYKRKFSKDKSAPFPKLVLRGMYFADSESAPQLL